MLLETLESCHYEAIGSYYPPGASVAASPIEWHGHLVRQGLCIGIEGSYRSRVGPSDNRFWLELDLPESPAGTGNFHLHCAHLNDAAGSFRGLRGCVLFGGRAPGVGTALSLSVQASKPAVLDCKGTLVFADGTVWLYDFEAVPTDLKISRGEVVRLRRHG